MHNSNKGVVGVSRKNKKPCTKKPVLLTDPHTPKSTALTKKQLEVLSLLADGENITSITRILELKSKNAVMDRLKGCKNKGYVSNEDTGIWLITKKGKELLKSCTGGMTASPSVPLRDVKSVHNYNFDVSINKFPLQWKNTNFFLREDLLLKDSFHNRTAKTWVLYYEQCTLMIRYGTNRCSFQVKDQLGSSFDEAKSKAWDVFVGFFDLLSCKGFVLDRVVSSNNPDLADPAGFFAMLAGYSNQKGFRLESEMGDFWIDYSLVDRPEEETNSVDWAERTQQLAESVPVTSSDFFDLDNAVMDIGEMKKVVGGLVKLEAMKTMPQNFVKSDDWSEADYFG